ncbi:hypothetical protein CRG98_020688 [Punica granatum]|uniref:Uncharacterized protein n=1 Tax=Punica granatum TaxID=22663 RepID=A0A2I0JRN6_PUNGR|nr:hypothetical protein CRG98_020688 [Punica granatum]
MPTPRESNPKPDLLLIVSLLAGPTPSWKPSSCQDPRLLYCCCRHSLTGLLRLLHGSTGTSILRQGRLNDNLETFPCLPLHPRRNPLSCPYPAGPYCSHWHSFLWLLRLLCRSILSKGHSIKTSEPSLAFVFIPGEALFRVLILCCLSVGVGTVSFGFPGSYVGARGASSWGKGDLITTSRPSLAFLFFPISLSLSKCSGLLQK